MTNSPANPQAGPQITQAHPEDAPATWAEVQDELASSSGVSILLIEGHQPPALVASNNNSICLAFQSSPEHVSLCDPYCGDAHRRAMEAGIVTQYKCHAGLECFTMPVQIGPQKNLAAIVGRAFVNTSDYRVLVERFRTGELKTLLGSQPFANVIFSDEQRLDQLARRLEKDARKFSTNGTKQTELTEKAIAATTPTNLLETKLPETNRPETIAPDIVAPDMTSALAPRELSNEDLAINAELAQLRSELEYRTRLTESLQNFLERISSSDPEKTYNSILTSTSELLQAERASLLVFDEVSNELIIKAAQGVPTEAAEGSRMRLGEGISGGVLASSKALVVSNIDETTLQRALTILDYKTKSFLSYPITIGGRRIGVLNVTDKSDGGDYDDVDLSLLEILGPQIAVALERAEWQERANEFQLMSITDPLTSLPNRRYLEERLTEELNRSKRYDYPMSFLMIDIDDFKSYNDLNGHQAGDLALQITAHNLKAALRSADVASRYGGEEFCILLPQTPLHEAEVIAERVRQRVANATYPHGQSQPLGTVTISVGIATFARHIDTAEKVIAAADRALYSAKNLGKNRIEIYQDNLTSRG